MSKSVNPEPEHLKTVVNMIRTKSVSSNKDQLRADIYACIELAKIYPFSVRELMDAYYSVDKKERSINKLEASCTMARISGKALVVEFIDIVIRVRKFGDMQANMLETAINCTDTTMAKGRSLSAIGLQYGTKRWLLGLEPDWSYRLRLLKILNPNTDGRGK